MHKSFIIISLILLYQAITLNAQNIEGFLRPYADAIVQETTFELTDKKTGERFSSTKNLPIKPNLTIESEFLQWRYTSALVYEGLRELGKELNDERYVNFPKLAFDFFFDHKEYYEKVKGQGYAIEGLENFMRFKGLWNDGAQVAALIDHYREDQRADYFDYMSQVADFFFSFEQNQDQNQNNKNIDQIYTKGVFMARMGELTGERKYFDYCVEQVLETDSLFYDPLTGLYDHYYYAHLGISNHIKWLRGSGWAAMGIVNILFCLPKDHPGYDKVLNVFHKIVIGVSAYQTRSGLWRHMIDRVDCFEETSGSTYIVYAIAKGINTGVLDPIYRDVAMAGWQGVMSMRDAEGNIKNVTVGVSSSTSPSYYYSNAFDEASTHFYGPLFLAGTEMMKLYRKYDGPKVRNWELMPID